MPIRPRLFTRSYCCILTANFLLYFGFWLLIPLLPFYLMESYSGLGEGLVGIILSCYTVAALLVRPFSGYLLDTFARKPLYLLAYGIFTILFLGYIVAGTLLMFILLRITHGLAFGAVTVGGNTVVVDIMPSARRGEGLGYYGLANNIAMSTGPMTGLFLHDAHMPFPWIFAVSFFTCLVGFVLAMLVRTPAKPKVARPAISLDRFVLIPGIRAGIALFLLSVPYGTTTNFVAMYVSHAGLKVVPGMFFVLIAAGMGVSRLFAGKFVDKGYVTECIHYGFYLVILAFVLLGACAPISHFSAVTSEVCFYLVPVFQGVGFGVMFPAYNSLFINLGRNDQRATATSTYLTSWDLGIGFGIFCGGMIAQAFSFSTVYFIGGALSLVSMIYFNRVVTPHYKSHKLR